MREQEWTFKSSDGISDIYSRSWEPDKDEDIIGCILLVHGMTEHIGRYSDFAAFLAANGFHVEGHDHIGHGKTAGSRDALGKMHGKHPGFYMMEDVNKHLLAIMDKFPDKKCLVMGHSMGSYITRAFLGLHPETSSRLSGALILGTGDEGYLKCTAGLALIGFIKLFKGNDYISPLISGAASGDSYDAFDSKGDDLSNSWLTRDVEIVKENLKDNMCNYTFSVLAYKGLVEITRAACSKKVISAIPKELPIHFASGTKDPVGEMGEGVRRTLAKYGKYGHDDISVELYEDMRHEILNEIGREGVYADLLEVALGWVKV